MIFGHFLLPFMLLLSRFAKRRLANLTAIAIYLYLIEIVWYFWKIMPAFHPDGFHIHWLDLVTLIAIGGLWLGVFAWHLQRAPLLAERLSRAAAASPGSRRTRTRTSRQGGGEASLVLAAPLVDPLSYYSRVQAMNRQTASCLSKLTRTQK